MSDTTGPAVEPTPVTEPLQLADQRPVDAAATPSATQPVPAKASHTRTILEVVGAVVAVFLILSAGTVGFVAGHATSSANRGDHFRSSASGQGGGMMGGQDPRGIDPDGDDWTGGGQGGGMMGGQGFGQGGGMMGGQDPRGIDPDGDNWTGGQGINPNAPQNTTPQPGQLTPSG
ncbi:MAG: hypothetical protein WCP95_07825 [Actinomycetes bacterium]